MNSIGRGGCCCPTRAPSDEASLARLSGFGIALDRDALRHLTGNYPSAEDIDRT